MRSADAKPEDAIGLTLKRQGLFTWKLSRLVLPKSFMGGKDSQAPEAQAPRPAAIVDSLIGKHPQDVFKTDYGQQLRQLVGAKSEAFENAITVASGVADEGGFIIGSGCLPHSCTMTESAFAIEKATGKMYAIMMDKGKFHAWGVLRWMSSRR